MSLKKGLNNGAFEQAGFINAIQVKIQPDSANWDAGDIRFNVLRWTSSPKPPFSGYGPSFVNPRTGEILGADIMLEWTYITNRIYQDNLFNDNNNFKNHDNYDQHQCDAHYQSFENTLALNYLESLNLSEEIKNDFKTVFI